MKNVAAMLIEETLVSVVNVEDLKGRVRWQLITQKEKGIGLVGSGKTV